jgi:hypothetical protein
MTGDPDEDCVSNKELREFMNEGDDYVVDQESSVHHYNISFYNKILYPAIPSFLRWF